jgi:transcriptional regulator with XRE-family HTH domain
MMTPARREPDANTYAGRFAIRLRQLREKAGLTHEEVAENTGVAARTIYSWEQSNSVPKVEQFPALAKTLRVKSPREILPKE